MSCVFVCVLDHCKTRVLCVCVVKEGGSKRSPLPHVVTAAWECCLSKDALQVMHSLFPTTTTMPNTTLTALSHSPDLSPCPVLCWQTFDASDTQRNMGCLVVSDHFSYLALVLFHSFSFSPLLSVPLSVAAYF